MDRLWRLGALTGNALLANDGEIGTVKEVYFDDSTWTVRYFVVRIGGPMTGANVVVNAPAIKGFNQAERGLVANLSRREIGKSLPAGCVLPVSRHYDAELRWRAEFLKAPIVPPEANAEDADGLPEPPFPHLRSSEAILSYSIHAIDGDLGRLKDLILDESEWRIRYLLIDTGTWLPGKKVLLPVAWVDEPDWGRKMISTRLPGKVIQEARESVSFHGLEHVDEVRLSSYYQRQGQQGRT